MSSATSFFPGAFSVGKSQRSQLWTKSDSPGPGAYLQEKKSPTSYQFSKSKRKPLFDDKKVPPPGSYDIKFTSSGPAFKIPNHLQIQPINPNLGPGSYNVSIQHLKQAPQYTFQSRFEEIAQESLKFPGPGAYSIKTPESPGPENKGLTCAKRDNNVKAIPPGPGSYNIPIERNNSVKFPQSCRDDSNTFITPGPGSFDLTYSMSQKGSTFGQRVYSNLDLKQSLPGPGTYQLKSFVDERKGPKIGTSQRGKVSNQNQLGPSPIDYDVSQYKHPSKGAKIGTAQRSTIFLNAQTPGPGQYQLESSELKGPKAVFCQSTKDLLGKNINITPGPGNYDSNDSMISQKSPSCQLLGKNERKDQMSLVGPGRYDVKRNIAEGPKFSFGSDERLKEEQSHLYNPGVGQYSYDSIIGAMPTYHRNLKTYADKKSTEQIQI